MSMELPRNKIAIAAFFAAGAYLFTALIDLRSLLRELALIGEPVTLANLTVGFYEIAYAIMALAFAATVELLGRILTELCIANELRKQQLAHHPKETIE